MVGACGGLWLPMLSSTYFFLFSYFMHAYRKLAFQVVWKCLKSLCGGGGCVESKFSDMLKPRPSQKILIK